MQKCIKFFFHLGGGSSWLTLDRIFHHKLLNKHHQGFMRSDQHRALLWWWWPLHCQGSTSTHASGSSRRRKLLRVRKQSQKDLYKILLHVTELEYLQYTECWIDLQLKLSICRSRVDIKIQYINSSHYLQNFKLRSMSKSRSLSLRELDQGVTRLCEWPGPSIIRSISELLIGIPECFTMSGYCTMLCKDSCFTALMK